MTDRNLTNLVNERRVRPAIRRLFNGDVSQIVGELIQNASRAGARRLEFLTSIDDPRGTTVRVRDDGSGILNGFKGWHALLSIADSSYEDENISMQDPLGIGLHALFACDKVSKVTFRSQGKMIEIETAKWWIEDEYFSTWAERLVNDDRETETGGLEIEIEAAKEFVQSVINALTAKEDMYRSAHNLPARGYEGVLEMTLDGEAVDTSVLSRFEHSGSALIWEGEYLGNRLMIAHGQKSCINWYGQSIEDTLIGGGFSYYLKVRRGTPLDLRSPTREGVIDNAKRKALRQFIVERVFEAVNGATIEKVKLEWVQGLYWLDPERADKEAKFYVVGKISNATETVFWGNEEFENLDEAVMAYDREDVLLLERGVRVVYQDGGEWKRLTNRHGVETFVDDLRRIYGEPYELITGDRKRLSIRELVWSPRNVTKSIFVDAGVFALREKGKKAKEWHAVAGEVFVFEETSAYSLQDSNPLVAARDRFLWLKSNYPNACFDPAGADDTHDQCEESWEESIDKAIMDEFPDTIAQPFSLADLSRRLGDGRITQIEVIWSEEYQPLLKVASEHGVEKELRVI